MKPTDAWENFAKEIGGEMLVERCDMGGRQPLAAMWNGSFKIRVPFEHAKISFHSLRGPGRNRTTVVLPYVPAQKFRFVLVSGKGNWLFNLLGDHQVQLHDPEFDKGYVLKSNEKINVAKLFQNKRVRELINSQSNFRFWILDNPTVAILNFGYMPNGVNLLVLMITENVDDITRLRSMHDLFSATYAEMREMRLISDKNPEFVF